MARMRSRIPAAAGFALVTLLAVTPAVTAGASPARKAACSPTRADALGPFYEPGAPFRQKVGTGYVLTGRVLALRGCKVARGARIEFWLANPAGEYDDAHRATVRAGAKGTYRFESNRPVPYAGRPPHVHVRVSAPGLRTLVTQHYPRPGASRAAFNLVLRSR